MALTNLGYTPATAEENIAKMQAILIAVFGADVDLSEASLQGLLVQEEANLLNDVETSKAFLYNELYDPYKAYGVFLDAIAAFDNIKRLPAKQSTIIVTLTGSVGTVIPANSQIKNSNNDIFLTDEAITIPIGGTITVGAKAKEYGLIQVAANTVNQIVTGISGWSTVNNPTSGIIGNIQENDTNLRNTRKYKLSLNSSSSVPAMRAAFAAQTFISDYYVITNDSDTAQSIGGVVIQPYSFYISLYYTQSTANDNIIAGIVYQKKTPGCPMQGTTIINYIDPERVYNNLAVKINVATELPLYVWVKLKNGTYPSTATNQIKAAIIANFLGNGVGDNAESRARMGETIYANRFYPDIIALGFYQIISITIGISALPNTSTVTTNINQYPTLIAANIQVDYI